MKQTDLIAIQHFGTTAPLLSQPGRFDVPGAIVLIIAALSFGTIVLTALVPLGPTPNATVAQGACVAAFQTNVDSAAKAHLTSTRLTAYQRRAIARVDSLAQVYCPGPVDSVEVGYGPLTRPYYSSGMWGKALPGTDTTTVCAVVHYPDHSERVGYPPIRFRHIGIDSATYTLRGGNPLREMCAWALGWSGLWAASFDSVEVTWSMAKIDRKWLPVAGVR